MLNNKLIIFVPTKKELKKILNISSFQSDGFCEYGIYKNIPVVICGIGKTNSSVISSYFHLKYKPEISLLTGLCGAYRNSNLSVGDTVSIKYDYFVDEAVFDGKILTTMDEKGFSPAPSNRGQCIVYDKFKEVNSNTVSFIPYDDNISSLYQKKYNSSVENMEGASFAYSANKFGVTPYQIRTVSNYCGSIENQKWNIELACSNLKKAIDDFINNFN